MFTNTSMSSNRVSFLGQYAEANATIKAAIFKQVERLKRRKAIRRYNRRIDSVNRYLLQVMPELFF